MAWPKGKPKPPETREKLSKALQAYWNAPEGRDRQFGPLSDETRRKLSEAMQGRHASQETRDKISRSMLRYWEDRDYKQWKQRHSRRWSKRE